MWKKAVFPEKPVAKASFLINYKLYVNLALLKKQSVSDFYKLIRGCNLLRKIKPHSFLPSFVGAVIGAGALAFSFSPAFSQEIAAQSTTTPVVVESSVPAVVTATGAGATAIVPDTMASMEKTSSGIDLPVPPPALTPEQEALQLQLQAEEVAAKAAEVKREEEYRQKSFNRAAGGLLPLSPDQIRDFLRRLESTQEASQAPFAGPPKGEVKVMALSLDPGGEPPQINLAAGYVTTIDMVDATGAPWPILDVGVGGNFEVTPTQAGSHVVRVVPLTRVGMGNLSILLKDLSTPVIFRLAAGGETFHMRYDARVPKLGPNAKTPLIERGRVGPVAGDQTIAMILENAPPKAAKRLKIAGLDARTMAWQLDDKVFVRTPLTLLSPAWNASASSPDGTTVYEIGDAPVLLMSDNGALMRARLTRDEDHDK